MSNEREIAKNYHHGTLEQTILDGLAANGTDVNRLTCSDLSSFDEFHLGGRHTTAALAADLGLVEGMRLLDIGAGIGGPARYFAEAHGCLVTGIELSEEYADVANTLTQRCGLADRASFRQASALALPFADASFDRATLIHVGMNIADKAEMFAQVRRVLKPGGVFGVYDLMVTGDGEIAYPTPWAMTSATSFLETPAGYRSLLAAAGFAIEQERNRRDEVLALGRKARERAAQHGAPPPGLQMLLGPSTPQRLANVTSAVERGVIAPVGMIARAI